VRVNIDLFATGHPEYSSDKRASLMSCPSSPARNNTELSVAARLKLYDDASTEPPVAEAVGVIAVTTARTIPAIANRAIVERENTVANIRSLSQETFNRC
jgi:hypothetical protein